MKTKYLLLFFLCYNYHFTFSQQIGLEVFGSSFNKPINIKNAADDKLFIVEQDGYIQILNSDGTKNSSPFLDIDSKVFDVPQVGDERGLLGLAFHPDYANNGFLFVNYINNDGNTVISRFTRNSANPNIADFTSEIIYLTIIQPGITHNGGDLAFGSDGYLYISTGDGGGVGDPNNNAQNLTNLLGCILRLDIDNPDTVNSLNYSIPLDNPFPNTENPNALPEIWAYGLRNPWKFSFDRNTGDLWIADVGQSNKEEINKTSSTSGGLNFGWRCFEGTADFNNESGCPQQSETVTPIAEYDYGGNPFKCAISGGYRYRGTEFSSLNGLYFFADYCSKEIGYLEPNTNETSWTMTFTSPDTGVTNDNFVSFGEDINGEIYVSSLVNGRIYKVIDETLSNQGFNKKTFNMYPNPAGENFTVETNFNSKGIVNIYNILGKRVKTINFNDSLFKINTTNINKGVYLVELIDNIGNKETKKLILN